MIGLIVVANPLIEIVLTEKWLPSVPYLQLFCIIGMLYPIQSINLNALNSLGRSNLYLKVDLLMKVFIVITILISYRFGITIIILGQVINSFIAYYLYSYYVGKLLHYPLKSQLNDLYSNLILSLVMGGLVYSLNFFNIENQLLLLIFQIWWSYNIFYPLL